MAFCCGALSAAISAVLSGCSTCEAYLECTTKPGLRYVACGKDFHSFNDGIVLTTASEGDAYCYCATLACTDGGSVQLCNRTPAGGDVNVRYSAGAIGTVEEGIDVCLGIEGCAVESEGCSHESWYLRCEDNGAVKFLTSAGLPVATKANAVSSCRLGGTQSVTTGVTSATTADDDPELGYCDNAVADCDELADCSESVACSDDAEFFGCASSPYCTSEHSGASACNADPACRWEEI